MERTNPSVRVCRIFSLLVVLSALALGGYYAWRYWPFGFPDDAYITLHNARVLLSGQTDTHYVGISPLVGATSLPHLLLVTCCLLFFPPLWAVWATGMVSLLLYLLGVTRLAFVMGASLWQALLLVIAALTAGLSYYHIFNGLETGLAMAGLIWTLVLTIQPSHTNRYLLAFLCGFLPFLRPEFAAFSILLLIHLGWEAYRTQSHTERGIPIKPWLVYLLLCIVGALPWLILYKTQTGEWIPSTIGAKRAFFVEGCRTLPWKFKSLWFSCKQFGEHTGLWLLVPLLLAVSRIGRLALLFITMFLGAYLLHFPGSLAHNESRYLYILIPLFVLGITSFVVSTKPFFSWTGTLLLCLLCMQGLWWFPRVGGVIAGVREFAHTTSAPTSQWLEKNVSKSSTVLVHDAGYVAYHTSLKLSDIVGLKSPQNASIHRLLTWPTCGKRGGDALHMIALKSKAKYMVVLYDWEASFSLGQSLFSRGWTVDVVYKPPSTRGYYVLHIQPFSTHTKSTREGG